MDHDLQFDVAFSYASAEGWIARDLYNLVSQSGLSLYCYDLQPDRVAGFLRARLLDIYRDSRLNVILWSSAYAQSDKDSVPAMERRCIINRHVEMGEPETLLLVTIDGEPLSREIKSVLAHDIRQHGILRTSRLVIQRIGKLSAGSSASGLTKHPNGTEADRSQLRPCTFQIDPGFRQDRRGRWRKLSDVLVKFPNPLETKDVYLIPSGACSPLLRHSDILKTQPDLLDHKRRATEAFVEKHRHATLNGFWFAMRKGESEIATVYAPEYDAALNSSLMT